MSDRDLTPYPSTGFDWPLWARWVLASTLGWLFGWALVRPEFAIGAAVGLAQWLVLRALLPRAWWWILASAAGWALGSGVVIALLPAQVGLLSGLVIGAAVGIAQWLVLRPWLPGAIWWAVVSAPAWALGLSGFLLGASLAGASVGATTGVALVLLLRRAPDEMHVA